MVLTMTMTLDQDHGQRNDATVWKYETQWPSMTVVYAKQLPAVDIGAGPISEEGNPGKANGHSSLHTQSQHNSSSVNFNLLSSLPVNTTNFQVSLRKKKRSKLQSSQKQENNKIETWWLGGVPQQPHLWCYSVYSKLTPSRSWKSKFLQLLRCPLLLDFFFVFFWFLCSKKELPAWLICCQVLKRTSGGTARHRAGLQLPFRLTRGRAAGSEVVFQQGLTYFCPFCPLMSTGDKN